MQIGLNWKIALKWTFFINLNALKAIILCIFGVGMCPESLSQKKIFEIFFVTFTVESTLIQRAVWCHITHYPLITSRRHQTETEYSNDVIPD